MAQWLRALAVLAGDQSLILSTNVKQLSYMLNTAPENPVPSSGLCCYLILSLVHSFKVGDGVIVLA